MRNKVIVIFYFSLLFVLLNGCQNDRQHSSEHIQLIVQEEITLNEQAAQNLHSIYPIASASKNDEIIALANLQHPVGVTLIDYKGNFIGQVGSEGQGPEEIQSARFIGLDNQNNVVINDKILALIKKYDRSNDTVRSFDNLNQIGIDISSRDMRQCGDTWILSINHFEYAPSDTSSSIGIFNEEFQLVEMFGNYDPHLIGKRTILQEPLFSIDCEEKLVYSTHIKIPYIQVYDLNDYSHKERIDVMPPSFKLSERFIDMVENQEEYREFLIEEQSMSLLLTHNKDHILLLYRNDTPEFYETKNFIDRHHFVAVYSKEDFSFLGETRIKGAALGTTKEGYLITLLNDDPDDFRLNLIEVVVDKEQENF
ncbi:MAG: hypothetical protein WD604_10465 [Balneolaceae bacterium]